ncbi:hypothetical protein HYY75_13100, partial [bacterium]|nr:hypothetical protein [bacterium]
MTESKRQNKLAYWVILWVIFGFFPICLAYVGLETFLSLNSKNQLDKLEIDLRGSLNVLGRTAKKESFLYRLLEKESSLLEMSSDLPKDASKLCERLNKRYPGLFSALIMDSSGKFLTGKESPERLELIKSLFNLTREIRENGNFEKLASLFREKGEELKAILGEKITFSKFILQPFYQEVTRVSDVEEKAFFFHHCSNEMIFLCRIRDTTLTEKEMLGDTLETFNKDNPGLEFGLMNESEKNTTKLAELSFLESCRDEYKKTFKTAYFLEGQLLLFKPLDTSRLLWGFGKFSRGWALQTLRGCFLVFGLFFLLATGIPSYKILVSEQSHFFSIRWKLVALLTFSSGIPLLVLWFTGIEYFFEKQRNLTSQVSQDLIYQLRSIDENVNSINMRNLFRLRDILAGFNGSGEVPV